MSKVYRNWCFTINNPNYSDCDDLDNLVNHAKYMIVGSEFGDEGTHHFQGFVILKSVKRLSGLKKLLKRAHLEDSKGNWEQNYTYCSKEGDFIEYGDKPLTFAQRAKKGGESNKEKWRDIIDIAKVGDYETLMNEYPAEFVRYQSSLMSMQKFADVEDLPNGTVCGVWIQGKSGVGKTTYVKNKLVKDKSTIYRKDLTSWWDGYSNFQHSVVHIDDMDPFSKIRGRDFKIWTQEDAFNAQVKGGYMKIRPKLIVVTSQYSIEEIWDDQKTLEAIKRRFKVYEISKKGEEPSLIYDPNLVQ